MQVSLPLCCLGFLKFSFRFKDFFQHFYDKQVKEHLLLWITSMQLIFFPLHFHLSIETAIDFFYLLHFKRGTGIYLQLLLSVWGFKTNNFSHELLFVWTSLSCKVSETVYLIVFVTSFLHVHACVFVIDSATLSVSTRSLQLYFLTLIVHYKVVFAERLTVWIIHECTLSPESVFVCSKLSCRILIILQPLQTYRGNTKRFDLNGQSFCHLRSKHLWVYLFFLEQITRCGLQDS